MDLAVLTNAPREVTLGGKTYLVSAMTLNDWGALLAFLKDHWTDPVVAVFKDFNKVREAGVEIDDTDRKALYAEANARAKNWPPRVGSKAWYDLMGATEGATEKFVETVLRKHQPDITDDELKEVFAGMDQEQSRILTHRAMGLDPSPKGPQPGTEPEGAPRAEQPPTDPTTGPAASTPSPTPG